MLVLHGLGLVGKVAIPYYSRAHEGENGQAARAWVPPGLADLHLVTTYTRWVDISLYARKPLLFLIE